MEDDFTPNLPTAQLLLLLLLLISLSIMSLPYIQKPLLPLYHSDKDLMPSTNCLVWHLFPSIPPRTYKAIISPSSAFLSPFPNSCLSFS